LDAGSDDGRAASKDGFMAVQVAKNFSTGFNEFCLQKMRWSSAEEKEEEKRDTC
jgi:hypothetical protein